MKPLLRGHFHQAMFFVSLGAGLPLLVSVFNSTIFLPILIYVTCALTLFGVSTIYHRVNWSPKERAFWRKLDHSSIYLMIAGTVTPIAWIVLPATSSEQLLMMTWIVCAIGILQSIFFVHIPKILSAAIYLIAGYLVLPYLPELQLELGRSQIFLILLGGAFYSIGAICYGLKKPKINPNIFSYHEVFHIMVNIGAILHFIVIKSLI